MDNRHIKKILNFLGAVAKDGNHREDHILLTTNVIGVPDIDVYDVKMALMELDAIEDQAEMMVRVHDKITTLFEKVNLMKSEVMGAVPLELPGPALMLEPPVNAAIRLPHTGTMGVICLG